ncbi:RNA-directed DNA polymerase from mobile element jockey [Trichonephila clavata]|uniref:RNA-directed DNA polymerase from mobile element jockey n=1 Tax=Trichonephila clavata TaxID=2740835 RepID=A0A8X6J577_TRICU|nr:RNA-directed DNA polymerase from mobile element jockey [Trichonephila clavata]
MTSIIPNGGDLALMTPPFLASQQDQKWQTAPTSLPFPTSPWLKIWRIKINTDKSHAIVFRKGNYNNNMPPLMLFSRPIPWSTSVEYLGITLGRKLTFKNHLSKIKCKFKHRLTALRNLLYFKSALSIQNKRRIFLSTYNHCSLMVALFGAWPLKPTSENFK